ncbi:MAG: OmpH family outer membrane protein, partial [Acidobacteriota bacterium]
MKRPLGRRSLAPMVSGIIFLVFCSLSLWAQSPATGDTHFGFVSGLDILYGTQTGQQQIVEVQAFMEEKQKEYDALRMDLERLRERFETQQLTLNAQTRAQMQRDIEVDDRNMKRFQEDTQVEITRRRDEILSSENGKIQNIINEYAQENDFSVIFMRDETQIYVDPSLDLTQEIIRVYDERYPTSSPAAS